MTHAHLTDEERNRLMAMCVETIAADDMAFGYERQGSHIGTAGKLARALKQFLEVAAPAETPPQDAPDEVADIKRHHAMVQKIIDDVTELTSTQKGQLLVQSHQNIRVLLRLLKRRPAATRDRLAREIYSEVYGCSEPWEKAKENRHLFTSMYQASYDAADAIFASGVVRELPTEERIKSALRYAQNIVDGIYAGASVDRGDRTDLQIRTDAVLRLINGEG